MGLFHDYKLVEDQEHAQNASDRRKRAKPLQVRSLLYLLLTATLCAFAFAAGKYHSPPKVPLATKSYVFDYDASYQDEQSPLTDEKWRALFPERKGFFSHPDIAKERSAFAIFHQLHCLNGIRKGYWELYEIASSNQPFPGEDSLPEMSAPHHIRHCLELLRQTLMCQPDLTVELKNETLGGVTGFGTEHQCKSWNDLMGWTAKWESYGLDPSSVEQGSHVHHQD